MRDAPEGVAESVRLCVATGVAGLSIEDSTGDDAKPLYDFDLAVARVRAARAAIDKAGGDVLLTAPRRRLSRSAGPISTRPSGGSKPIRPPAPTASTRPASSTREQIEAVVQGGRAEAGQFADGGRVGSHGRAISPSSACAASASAARSRAWPGAPSCAPPARSPSEGSFDSFTDAVSHRRAQRLLPRRSERSDRHDRRIGT